VCSVPVCVTAGFIASGWAWHYEPVLRRRSERSGFGDGWAYLRFGVTFEHCKVLPWAWQEVKGDSMSVSVHWCDREYCRAGWEVMSGCDCNGAVLLRPHRK
jgi:hypothetical protein